MKKLHILYILTGSILVINGSMQIVNPPANSAVCCAYTAATVLYLYGAAKENVTITQQPKRD